MTTQNFCYWLQGFFEISGADATSLTEEQVKMIKSHLRLVFKDSIDPSMGDKEHQEILNNLHEGKLNLQDLFQQNPHGDISGHQNDGGSAERC